MSFLKPFYDTEFESVIGFISRVAKQRESGIIYYYSTSDLEFRLKQVASISDYTPQFVHLAASNQVFDSKTDLNIMLESLGSTLIISGAEIWFSRWDERVLRQLNEFASSQRHSVLLFVETNMFEHELLELSKLAPHLLRNTWITPVHSDESTAQFLQYLALLNGTKLSKNICEYIVAAAGGHFWLAKEAFSLLQTQSNLPDQIMSLPSIHYKLAAVYESHSARSQKILTLVASGNPIPPDMQPDLQFLQKSAWITPTMSPRIRSQLLRDFILSQNLSKSQLENRGGRLLLKGVPISQVFSKSELKVVNHLTLNKNQVVSREELAKIIWGNRWEIEYSDWAVSQIIARIRKRLSSLMIPTSLIKTVRGRGFCYGVHH